MAPAAPASAPRRAPAKGGEGAAARSGAAAPRSGAAQSTRGQRNQRAIANARATQRAAAAPATRPAPARRKSGAAPVARPKPKTARAASPVARVLNSRGMPLVDRVLRGPVWVVMLGVLLAGIVFLNVSVLELNRGIAQTDAKAAALERTNSSLRERVGRLDSGERIQALAAARGFVMPQPGAVTFVRPRASDAKLAAERITAPNSANSTTIAPATVVPTPSVTPPTTTVAPTTATAPTTTPAPVTPAAPVTQAAPAGQTAPTTQGP